MNRIYLMGKRIIKALPRGIRFFAILLLYILPVSGYAQLTGNILEIDYPYIRDLLLTWHNQ